MGSERSAAEQFGHVAARCPPRSRLGHGLDDFATPLPRFLCEPTPHLGHCLGSRDLRPKGCTEDGDSGQVGRGNRVNGLIAFARPSGEATAGKNALAHTGKVYSVLSHHLAHAIRTTVPGLAEVYVHLAARIGDPIDRPWVGVQVVPDDGVALADVEAAIRQTVLAQLEQLPEFRTRLARGEFPVC